MYHIASHRIRTIACHAAAVVFAVSLLASIGSRAQDLPKRDEPGSRSAPNAPDKAPPPRRNDPRRKDERGQPEAKPSGPKATEAKKKPSLGRTIPEAPAERAKLLDDLYAHLATAADEETAKPFADTIERVWLTSGSDTVATLMERAMQAAGHQRNDLALQLLSAVVDLAPDYAEGWNRRAYVFYTEGDYERSLGDLRRVLALDPNHYKALDGLGQIMRQLDRKAQALQAYEKLQMVHPYWPNIQTTVEELRREVQGRAL